MYHRKSIRLKDYDYRTAAYYFVTICTQSNKLILGECSKDDVLLSPVGELVQECWRLIPQFNAHVSLDEFVVMPNHIHGILNFNENPKTQNEQKRCSRNSLSGSLASIICGFKTASTKRVKKLYDCDATITIWQERYYEHIIRNERSLTNIRAYIRNNPASWHLDKLNDRCSNIRRTNVLGAMKSSRH